MQYLDQLNDVQRQAVTHIEGPLMVIAGPGSGKTRVLTYRVAHLIQQGVHPYRILALTFTNKAAREMKDRIARVVGPDADRVWAGTFHSIFARILRVEAKKIGYTPDFTIYDRDDSRSLLSEILKELKLDKTTYNPSAVLARISSAKSNLITPERYARDEELIAYDKISKRPMVYEIYSRYVKRCFRAGAMDFDDLLLQMFKLLYENPNGVKEKYQQLFQYVLVDEFQDTNYLQYEIIKQFVLFDGSPLNVCIVGDDAQSIYSFRGATIQNIFQFEQDFDNTAVYKLEQNYRSTEHIVKAANKVISQNKKQIKKEIWTDQLGGNKISMIKALSDAEEGRLVSNAIIEYKNRFHLRNRDIAILYRTNAQSRVFEENLRRNNIVYRVFGGLSFYQRKEVKDLLAYIRLTVNSRDDEALRRIINYPKRGIGRTTFEKIIQVAEDNDISFWDSLLLTPLSARAGTLIKEFVQLLETCRKKTLGSNAYEAALYIARQSGIHELLRSDNSIEGMTRLENLNALLDGIKEFIEEDELEESETVSDKSLSSYLQNIALLTDMDENTDEQDYISLMSAHSAKGLEFNSVFVVGLEENLFPSYLSMSSPAQLEEERRLFYVAITRAEQHLTLSFAGSRYQYGQIRFNDPSRFIEEIDEEHFESTMQIRPRPSFSKPRVLGGLKRSHTAYLPKVDPSTFSPSPGEMILEGMEVLHLKFGKGRVLKIDGARNNRVATIHFDQIANPERRIMLRFAKLQIMN
jgi:DNA helicase-2/ATP-dependent DNA helicase PcrA